MDRHAIVRAVGIVIGLICGPSLAATAGPGLNVLFVVADDLNCDVGCYGHNLAKTPNIDRLAARGVRFDRAYVQYTVCNPSRTSFLTGLRPETTGVLGNDVAFRSKLPDVVTLPQLFRSHGYRTFGLGKVFHRGLSPDEVRTERDDRASWDATFYGATTPRGRQGQGRNMSGGVLPWCRWLAAEGDDDDQHDGQLAGEAVRLLEQNRDRPFFMAVGFYRPHDPFVSPKKYFDMYPINALEPPRSPRDRSPLVPYALGGGATATAFGRFTDQDRREFLRAYFAGVSFMDAQLGRILDALDRLDLARRTVVVFIGDHGYELGVRDWWNKNTLFERSCRTPMIVATPASKGNGKVAPGLVEFVDLYPTLADLCDLKPPAGLAGLSLRPTLDDPSRGVKESAFTTVQRGAVTGLSIRTRRYRYTEWTGGKAAVELYDHESDEGEWHNLAERPDLAPVLAELSGRLAAFRRSYPRRP